MHGCVRLHAYAREMVGIDLLVQDQSLATLAMRFLAAKQPNWVRRVDGDGKSLALLGDDDSAFSFDCTNGTEQNR